MRYDYSQFYDEDDGDYYWNDGIPQIRFPYMYDYGMSYGEDQDEYEYDSRDFRGMY